MIFQKTLLLVEVGNSKKIEKNVRRSKHEKD